MSTQDNNKPLTEQAKEAMASAGQKASETWEATKQKVSEVGSEPHYRCMSFYFCFLGEGGGGSQSEGGKAKEGHSTTVERLKTKI